MTFHKSILLAAALFCHSQTALAQSYATTDLMPTAGTGHVATLLADGRVLLVLASGGTQIYTPQTGQWQSAPSMTVATNDLALIRLADGRVLATGGSNANVYSARAEIFDANTNTWSATGGLTEARNGHSLERLPDGSPIVIGGRGVTGLTSSVEIFSAATSIWTLGQALPEARSNHVSLTLANGDILVLGGTTASGPSAGCRRLPAAGGPWVACASMPNPRVGHRAIVLADGRILVSGGATSANSFETIYNVATDTWTSTAMPSTASSTAAFANSRYSVEFGRPTHVVFESAPGTVVIWGGSPASTYSIFGDSYSGSVGAAVYNVAANTFFSLPESTLPARSGHSLTRLYDGRYLVAGGFFSHTSSTSLGTFSNAVPTNLAGLVTPATLPTRRQSSIQLIETGGYLPFSPEAGERYPVRFSVSPVPYTITPPLPTGTVTVSDSAGAQCTAALPTQTCRLTSITAGPRELTLNYSGDAEFLPAAAQVGPFTPAIVQVRIIGPGLTEGVSYSAGGFFGFGLCGRNAGPIPDQCGLSLSAGQSTTITASPVAGTSFVGWQGGCAGTETTCTVAAPSNGSIEVKAHFAPSTWLPLTLDIDGDSRTSTTTDGTMLIRSLLYVHDASLTQNAVGPSATRGNPQEIGDRITAMRPLLDLDQNGRADALTDGVMLLRHLFGIRGDSLTANAIGAGARRNDPSAIQSAIQSLIP